MDKNLKKLKQEFIESICDHIEDYLYNNYEEWEQLAEDIAKELNKRWLEKK